MRKKGGEELSLLFLEPEKIREILREASQALLLPVSEELLEETALLIESMGEDLLKLYKFPLHNTPPFHSHESFGLKELDEFYQQYELKSGFGSSYAKIPD